jgi:hypothetical protein
MTDSTMRERENELDCWQKLYGWVQADDEVFVRYDNTMHFNRFTKEV